VQRTITASSTPAANSCQAKRAALFGERLTEAILAPVPHRHWTFSIPRVLRGLVERDRKLLGLLSQAAYAFLLKTFQALFDRKDVRPGCVIALQTFGAYAGNWNPHAHAIVSDGVFTAKGEFLPLPALDTAVVLQVLRQLWLRRLPQAERLSEAFMNQLLSWVHPGFTVFAGPPVEAGNLESLESQARYIARPAMAMDALQQRPDATLAMETPSDPRSGATLVVLDPLEWIHRITAHIPDPRQHTRRSYGAYCNRARVAAAAKQGESDGAAQARSTAEDSAFARETRRTWARLLRKIFEADPLLCSCGAEMKIVSIITQPRVVERILRHLGSDRCQARDPFESRAPPRARAFSLRKIGVRQLFHQIPGHDQATFELIREMVK
jgi:hypothetical protein